MAVWRTLGTLVIVLASVRTALAQSYKLSESVQAGDCFRVQLGMKLTGEIKVTRDGKLVPLKQEATATHEFSERVLAVGTGGLPEKTARAYEIAHAVLTVVRDRSERSLRADRRLMVAQRCKE